ncbi:hypothetical protein MHL31_04245 [Lutibacter sp. A80]|uniref:hypothetical protein n=1 Tax=Lutibacter sp. A80 TaxID=2918453 RepID=UPI001F058296|nr:hypothetical protein [Lutibacter sp. A80]UMB61419.1 hypothetical protein MHL31_04245 [Lutibacter sp. A80]
MKKLIAVSIANVIERDVKNNTRIIEIEQIQDYLNDGYNITNTEIIITPTSTVFTVIYQLEK